MNRKYTCPECFESLIEVEPHIDEDGARIWQFTCEECQDTWTEIALMKEYGDD